MPMELPKLSSVLNRNLIFIHGKGGVGKTVVSQAIAEALSQKSKKTLWVTIEDPTRPPGELIQISPRLWQLNCNFSLAFAEYIGIKIGASKLTQIFLQNKIIQYLSKASPGLHELVLLGKIWFERNHYDHVVVDMPSTGYGLAMFQSTHNFAKLFTGGPLHRDAQEMLETLKDAGKTGHLIVSLPEETPLRESLELNEYLASNFPENPACFLVNKLFPQVLTDSQTNFTPPTRHSPLANSKEDYVLMRAWLENYNLRIWRDAGVSFGQLDLLPPPLKSQDQKTSSALASQLQKKAYL